MPLRKGCEPHSPGRPAALPGCGYTARGPHRVPHPQLCGAASVCRAQDQHQQTPVKLVRFSVFFRKPVEKTGDHGQTIGQSELLFIRTAAIPVTRAMQKGVSSGQPQGSVWELT